MADKLNTNTISKREFMEIQTELIEEQRIIDKATGRKRAILKRAKGAGADLDAIALLRKLSRIDDDVREAMLGNLERYAAWEGVSLIREATEEQPQGGMFEEADDEATAEALNKRKEALVYNDGWNTAKAGGNRETDNPHVAGVAGDGLHAAWVRAFDDYVSENGAPGVKRASAAKKPVVLGEDGKPRPPGRPRGSTDSKPRGRRAAATNADPAPEGEGTDEDPPAFGEDEPETAAASSVH